MSDSHPGTPADGVGELELAAHLTAEPDPPSPRTGQELLALADRPPAARRPIAPFVAVAAALALAVLGAVLYSSDGADSDRLTMRGVGAVAPELELRWLIDGSETARAPHGAGAPTEQVVCAARSSAPGCLCGEEQTAAGGWGRVLPPEGERWTVEPGDSLPRRGDTVLAFRTDDGPGHRLYRLLLDPDNEDCRRATASDEVSIEWLP